MSRFFANLAKINIQLLLIAMSVRKTYAKDAHKPIEELSLQKAIQLLHCLLVVDQTILDQLNNSLHLTLN